MKKFLLLLLLRLKLTLLLRYFIASNYSQNQCDINGNIRNGKTASAILFKFSDKLVIKFTNDRARMYIVQLNKMKTNIRSLFSSLLPSRTIFCWSKTEANQTTCVRPLQIERAVDASTVTAAGFVVGAPGLLSSLHWPEMI